MRGRCVATIAGALLCGQALSQTAETGATATAPNVVPTHVLRFHLELHEMLPKTVTVPTGKYALDVTNGAVLAPITIQVSAAGANGANAVVSETTGKAADSRVRTLFTLTPGTYTIGIRSRPEWTATIAVTKQ